MRSIFAALFATSLSCAAVPLDTRFTYQGELRDGAGAASGLHEFEFLLFDAATGTNQIGPTNVFSVANGNPVSVANGLFTVALDFNDAFTGQKRFLQVRVKRQADAGYTILTPRQELTPAPHALHAEFVADGHVDAASLAPGAVGAAAIDPTQVQRRISGACAAGESISSVAADGTATCETDDSGVTSFVGQNGITGAVMGSELIVSTDATVQRRIASPACPDFSTLRAIGTDGTPTCVPVYGGQANGVVTAVPESLAIIGVAGMFQPDAPTRITVTVSAIFGTTGGASGLSVHVCRSGASTMDTPVPIGGTLTGIAMPSGLRTSVTTTASVALPANETVTIGLCAQNFGTPDAWDNNGNATITFVATPN